MQTLRRVGTVVAVLLGLAAVQGRAAITQTVNYQGFLTDKATGLPIDGTRDMQFRLCGSAAASCASALFAESRCAAGGNGPAVGVAKGRYEVEVGSSTAGGIPAAVFTNNSSVWLEVLVDTNGDCTGFEALSPRLRMQGAPYAFSALQASTAAVLSVNPPNCVLPNVAMGVAADGTAECGQPSNVTGNAFTATALAGNGTNCAAGNYPLGVDASGNAESCTADSAVPAGAVMFFNLAACPSGWSEYTSGRGRYLVGLPLSGTLQGIQGTALTDVESRATGQHFHLITDPGHAHVVSDPGHNHTHWYNAGASAGGTANQVTGSGFSPISTANSTTGVTVNSNTTGITVQNAGIVGTNAPYIQLLLCQKL